MCSKMISIMLIVISSLLISTWVPLALGGDELLSSGNNESLSQIQEFIPLPAEDRDPFIESLSTLRTGGMDGNYDIESPPGLPQAGSGRAADPYFGDDRKVRFNQNLSSAEFNHAMASDKEGNLYVAWQDDYYDRDRICVYKSMDAGRTWSEFGSISFSNADLSEPSLAVGQGSAGDYLLIAVIYDDGSIPRPMIAYSLLSSLDYYGFFPPINSSGAIAYAKPVIVTDSLHYSDWRAYLTCEEVWYSSLQNINICCWRSEPGGVFTTLPTLRWGSEDDDAWLDPHICYGTTQHRVFIVGYNATTSRLYTAYSSDRGITWSHGNWLHTMSLIPSHPVDPEIAAAKDNDNVMICCTLRTSAAKGDDIGQIYSKEAGNVTTWSSMFTLQGSTEYDEHAPSLIACQGGGSWHLSFMNSQMHTICYSRRPQDLSGYWQPVPYVVDDLCEARSHGIPGKSAIAAIPTLDVACIAWADTRDHKLNDFDTYSDYGNNTGLMVDRCFILEDTGGTVHLTMHAGSHSGGRTYLLLGGVSGYSPGTPLPGGSFVLPLNLDVFSYEIVLPLINTTIFQNFMGTLNSSGAAYATLNAPPVPGYAGITMHYASLLGYPFDWTSNPVTVTIFP